MTQPEPSSPVERTITGITPLANARRGPSVHREDLAWHRDSWLRLWAFGCFAGLVAAVGVFLIAPDAPYFAIFPLGWAAKCVVMALLWPMRRRELVRRTEG